MHRRMWKARTFQQAFLWIAKHEYGVISVELEYLLYNGECE